MPVDKKLRAAALGVGLLAGFAAPATAATYRAMVVGIDDYVHEKKLTGATNDARLIHGRLQALGIPVKALLNAQATRGAILKTYKELLDASAPGDTIIFTYAGHGNRQTAADPSAESDGMDEYMPLAAYRPGGGIPAANERIIDNDLAGLWKAAAEKGVKVVILFDSCHSGTATRSLDDRNTILPTRDGPSDPGGPSFPDDPPPPPGPIGPSNDGVLPPGIFYYAASADHEVVTEIDWRGRRHGAMSVAFAEALEGAADRDDDGMLSHAELAAFLAERVRLIRQAVQTPRWDPETLTAAPVLPAVRAWTPTPPPPRPPTITLRILGMPQAQAQALAARLAGVTLARAGEVAVLVWDASDRTVISDIGDVVAVDIAEQDLSGVVEKWRALAWLREQPRGGPLALRLEPNEGVQPEGAEINFSVKAVNGQNLVIFNLQGDGQVRLIYPYGGDSLAVPGNIGDFKTCVVPPFGTDHVIAVSARADSRPLIAALQGLEQQKQAWMAVSRAVSWVQANSGRLGQQTIVTKEGSKCRGVILQ